MTVDVDSVVVYVLNLSAERSRIGFIVIIPLTRYVYFSLLIYFCWII